MKRTRFDFNVAMAAMLLAGGMPSIAMNEVLPETEEERRARLARLDAAERAYQAREASAAEERAQRQSFYALRPTLESPCPGGVEGAHTVETRANGRICTLCRTWGPLLAPPETRQQRRAAEREKKSRKR